MMSWPLSEVAWVAAGFVSALILLFFGYLAGWRKGRKATKAQPK